MRTSYSLAVSILFTALLGACSSTPKAPEATAPVAAQNTAVKQHDTRQVQGMNTGSLDPLNDPKGALAQRSVYFDFNQYDVKSQYTPLETAHAKYLEAHNNRKIVIQGNTDDRGGSEYNLALGEKRAEAVLTSLKAMGVPASQMEAVSFGKEKPKATGEDEAAWSQNRRADIVYGGAGK